MYRVRPSSMVANGASAHHHLTSYIRTTSIATATAATSHSRLSASSAIARCLALHHHPIQHHHHSFHTITYPRSLLCKAAGVRYAHTDVNQNRDADPNSAAAPSSSSNSAPSSSTHTAAVGGSRLTSTISPAVSPHIPPPRVVARTNFGGSSSSSSSSAASSSMNASFFAKSSAGHSATNRATAQQLLDIEAYALTETDPEKRVSLEAYKSQFNYILQKDLGITELMRVFRSWVSHMPSPPELSYIHVYIESRVRKGHAILSVLEDLQPFLSMFTEETLIQLMLLCAKQRNIDGTISVLRYIHTHISHKIPFTLSLMNKFINNFSLQNDISGATILYDELSNYSLIPDQETYRAMYLGFARMKEMNATLSVFSHMQSRDISLTIDMFESVIEVCVRYDQCEAGLMMLGKILEFNATQPVNSITGTKHELVLTSRCFELLIHAYLQKQQLDHVMSIYYELRKIDLVLTSTQDFNALLEMITKNLSFQEALQVMADRIQATEKYRARVAQLQAVIDAASQAPLPLPLDLESNAASRQNEVKAAESALSALVPIGLPSISSFNILLRIAGLTDRNVDTITLIISELQRVEVTMDTDTYNILIQSYANLSDLKGMVYIYGEFRQSAMAQAEMRRQTMMPAADGTTPIEPTSASQQQQQQPTTADPSIVLPDVRTYNIMLGQIDPKTFQQNLYGVENDSNAASSNQPNSLPPMSPAMAAISAGLNTSEAAAMQMVESLLLDMRTFHILPDEATFKLILTIMSGVGTRDSTAPFDASTLNAPVASAVVSPHVVHFFNMLMDLVVAHQASSAASSSSSASANSVAFESSWYSFLDFLYRSSNASNQATNFHYILLCLRRLKSDGCLVPKSVIKTLLLNHLGGAKKSFINPTTNATAAPPTTHISEVHWIQAIYFLREFSPANQIIDEDILSAMMRSALSLEIEQRRADGVDINQPSRLLPIVLQHMQRLIVWNLSPDMSRLTPSQRTQLNQTDIKSSVDEDIFNFSSLTTRDRNHHAIFVTCINVRQYQLARDIITNMQAHQQYVQQQYEKAIADGHISANEVPLPALFVQTQFGSLFRSLLDGVRRYGITNARPLDWSPLRDLFDACQVWQFAPTLEHYRVLMDEAIRHRSMSLARFAHDTAVARAATMSPNQLASAPYTPDLRLTIDVLNVTFLTSDTVKSTRESRAASSTANAMYLSQLDLLQSVLTRLASTNLPSLPSDLIYKLLQVAEQLESFEIGALIHKYLISQRKTPEWSIYTQLIHLCRFQHAYSFALDLYRALQLVDRVPFDGHLALLHLHEYANEHSKTTDASTLASLTSASPSSSSMVWSIFNDLLRSVRNAPSVAFSSNSHSVTQVISALIAGIRSHTLTQQLDDLSKIGQIVSVLESSAPSSPSTTISSLDPDFVMQLEWLKAYLPPLMSAKALQLHRLIHETRETIQQLKMSEDAAAAVSSPTTKPTQTSPVVETAASLMAHSYNKPTVTSVSQQQKQHSPQPPAITSVPALPTIRKPKPKPKPQSVPQPFESTPNITDFIGQQEVEVPPVTVTPLTTDPSLTTTDTDDSLPLISQPPASSSSSSPSLSSSSSTSLSRPVYIRFRCPLNSDDDSLRALVLSRFGSLILDLNFYQSSGEEEKRYAFLTLASSERASQLMEDIETNPVRWNGKKSPIKFVTIPEKGLPDILKPKRQTKIQSQDTIESITPTPVSASTEPSVLATTISDSSIPSLSSSLPSSSSSRLSSYLRFRWPLASDADADSIRALIFSRFPDSDLHVTPAGDDGDDRRFAYLSFASSERASQVKKEVQTKPVLWNGKFRLNFVALEETDIPNSIISKPYKPHLAVSSSTKLNADADTLVTDSQLSSSTQLKSSSLPTPTSASAVVVTPPPRTIKKREVKDKSVAPQLESLNIADFLGETIIPQAPSIAVSHSAQPVPVESTPDDADVDAAAVVAAPTVSDATMSASLSPSNDTTITSGDDSAPPASPSPSSPSRYIQFVRRPGISYPVYRDAVMSTFPDCQEVMFLPGHPFHTILTFASQERGTEVMLAVQRKPIRINGLLVRFQFIDDASRTQLIEMTQEKEKVKAMEKEKEKEKQKEKEKEEAISSTGTDATLATPSVEPLAKKPTGHSPTGTPLFDRFLYFRVRGLRGADRGRTAKASVITQLDAYHACAPYGTISAIDVARQPDGFHRVYVHFSQIGNKSYAKLRQALMVPSHRFHVDSLYDRPVHQVAKLMTPTSTRDFIKHPLTLDEVQSAPVESAPSSQTMRTIEVANARTVLRMQVRAPMTILDLTHACVPYGRIHRISCHPLRIATAPNQWMDAAIEFATHFEATQASKSIPSNVTLEVRQVHVTNHKDIQWRPEFTQEFTEQAAREEADAALTHDGASSTTTAFDPTTRHMLLTFKCPRDTTFILQDLYTLCQPSGPTVHGNVEHMIIYKPTAAEEVVTDQTAASADVPPQLSRVRVLVRFTSQAAMCASFDLLAQSHSNILTVSVPDAPTVMDLYSSIDNIVSRKDWRASRFEVGASEKKADVVASTDSDAAPVVSAAVSPAATSVTSLSIASAGQHDIAKSFERWGEMSSRSLDATQLQAQFSQHQIHRAAMVLIEQKGFVLGLQRFTHDTSASDATSSTSSSGAPQYDRSAMLRNLFQYCLFLRSHRLFHTLCTQLQEANMLPRARAFREFTELLLTRWFQAQETHETLRERLKKDLSHGDLVASDISASLLEGDDWSPPTNEKDVTDPANKTNDLVAFIRASMQWMCVASKLSSDVWTSGIKVLSEQDEASLDQLIGKKGKIDRNAPKLNATAIQIGFNAPSLQKRLRYWSTRGIPLSVERVMNVYAFKTVCLLAIRGSYHEASMFLAHLSRLEYGVSIHAVFKSSIQWLATHEYHQQADQVWTSMMIMYIPKLKAHVQHVRAEAIARQNGQTTIAPVEMSNDDTLAVQTVKSLCEVLLPLYVLRHEDDTMLFRIYATMRSLDFGPPADLLGIIPSQMVDVDSLTPQQQLLYIILHRVVHMQGYTKIDYMMKLFGELIKIPQMAPSRFNATSDVAAGAAPTGEWPIATKFLDAISGRVVEEYIQPTTAQKLAKPEFAEQIKKLILHLDSDDAMSFTKAAVDSSTQLKRDRLWNLFIALQNKGVVFNVPLLHHLSQSLATKDAMLLSNEIGGDKEEESVKKKRLDRVPVPTLVQQMWKLIRHHGEFDSNTLYYLVLAQFRYYQSAQQQRGLNLRTIRSIEYYRHVLYGAPYDNPSIQRSSTALTTTFADVALSGFSSQVALAWLGFDKLDLPLPNIVHMFFGQVERDWHAILDEEAAIRQAGKSQEPGEEDVVDERFSDDTAIPMNAQAYNYVLQSCLLFTADSKMVKWSQIDGVRRLMHEHNYMLNSTSVLYLVDALIEADKLQEARAMLPPLSTDDIDRRPRPRPRRLQGLLGNNESPAQEAKLNRTMESIVSTGIIASPTTESSPPLVTQVVDHIPIGPQPVVTQSTPAVTTSNTATDEFTTLTQSPLSASLPSAASTIAPPKSFANPSSLWSRISGWFQGSDAHAAESTPPVASLSALAAAAASSKAKIESKFAAILPKKSIQVDGVEVPIVNSNEKEQKQKKKPIIDKPQQKQRESPASATPTETSASSSSTSASASIPAPSSRPPPQSPKHVKPPPKIYNSSSPTISIFKPLPRPKITPVLPHPIATTPFLMIRDLPRRKLPRDLAAQSVLDILRREFPDVLGISLTTVDDKSSILVQLNSIEAAQRMIEHVCTQGVYLESSRHWIMKIEPSDVKKLKSSETAEIVKVSTPITEASRALTPAVAQVHRRLPKEVPVAVSPYLLIPILPKTTTAPILLESLRTRFPDLLSLSTWINGDRIFMAELHLSSTQAAQHMIEQIHTHGFHLSGSFWISRLVPVEAKRESKAAFQVTVEYDQKAGTIKQLRQVPTKNTRSQSPPNAHRRASSAHKQPATSDAVASASAINKQATQTP